MLPNACCPFSTRFHGTTTQGRIHTATATPVAVPSFVWLRLWPCALESTSVFWEMGQHSGQRDNWRGQDLVTQTLLQTQGSVSKTPPVLWDRRELMFVPFCLAGPSGCPLLWVKFCWYLGLPGIVSGKPCSSLQLLVRRWRICAESVEWLMNYSTKFCLG